VVLFSNFSRLIGMVIRTFILITGGVFEFAVLSIGFAVLVCWFLLPLIIILLLMLAL
jgi:hypothetical protein